jgi:hypothetical protein
MEVGQGPNWGCSAKEKKNYVHNMSHDRSVNTVTVSEIWSSVGANIFAFATATTASIQYTRSFFSGDKSAAP